MTDQQAAPPKGPTLIEARDQLSSAIASLNQAHAWAESALGELLGVWPDARRVDPSEPRFSVAQIGMHVRQLTSFLGEATRAVNATEAALAAAPVGTDVASSNSL